MVNSRLPIIHSLIPLPLNLRRNIIPDRLRPLLAHPHLRNDAIRTSTIVCDWLAGQEVSVLMVMGLEVVIADVDEERGREEGRTVDLSNGFGEGVLLGGRERVGVLDLVER